MSKSKHKYRRFIFDKETNKVHDLNNEKQACQIERVKMKSHYEILPYKEKNELTRWFITHPYHHGCKYCLPEFTDEKFW